MDLDTIDDFVDEDYDSDIPVAAHARARAQPKRRVAFCSAYDAFAKRQTDHFGEHQEQAI